MKANLIQEQVNYSSAESFLKNIPFKQFSSFDQYYHYSLKHSIVPIDYSNKSRSVIDQFIDICSKNPQLNSQQFSSKNTSTTQVVNTKTINTDLWLTEDTKIKIKHLIPIFQLIGATTSNFQNLSNLLQMIEKSHSNYFPIKIVIPLFFTFNVTVEFQQFDFVPPTLHLFNLDEQIKKRVYSHQTKQINNSQHSSNPIHLYSSEQQKTLNKLYSTINKYKSKNGKSQGEDYEDDEEDQTVLDQASMQFRNILEQKKDKNEDNEDLFDVFQDSNNISSFNNNTSLHSNNNPNLQLILQNQTDNNLKRNKNINTYQQESKKK